MEAYQADHGVPEIYTPEAVGGGWTQTPPPRPPLDPSPEQEAQQYRERLRRVEAREQQLRQLEASRGPLDHLGAAIRKCFR
jgi:hypothetical protein